MIVFDRKEKEIKVPEGLGNINLTVIDANLEDRTVEINEVETTILPSSGYNGMSSIQIDAQPVYDNGYNEGENIGYNSGYTAGDIDGYNRGYNEGETEQKDKLVGIEITENGTYTREDGYNEVVVNVPDLNGSYDEGYDVGKVDGYDSGYTAGVEYASENANEIAAANAIDLVATEFGTYYTKYSDNIVNPNPVTGIYPNGETFHNLVETNKVFDTGIFANETTKLEFWVEFLNNNHSSSFSILSNDKYLNFSGGWGIAKGTARYENCTVCVGGANTIGVNLKFNKLYHIELSFSDGLIVDGEQLGTFSDYGNKNQTLLLNGWTDQSFDNVYNRFGMIKITTDGITNVIIPTENGFLNTTTIQLLEVVKDFDTYEYTNNDLVLLDNLIKTVNVQPKIDVEKYGVKLSNSTFKEIPDFYDFSNSTNMSYMFQNCGSLQTIPLIDTSNVTNMSYMLNGCGLLQTMSLIDTSNVTDMSYMFQGAGITTIPLIDTSNVTNMNYMFAECKSLPTIPELNTRKVTSMEFMFYTFSGLQNLVKLPKIHCDSCTSLNKFFAYNDNGKLNNLTDVGGWINLKCNFNGVGGLVCLPNLTYQSCINILNGLYDFTGNGETPTSSQGQLKVHSNFLTTVGDEISIATAKGWSISA